MASESGPYSVCQLHSGIAGDSPNYHTVKWGYDSWKEAYDDVANLSKEAGVPRDEYAVIKVGFIYDLDTGISFDWDEE